MDNKYMNFAQEHMKHATEYGQNLFSTAKATGSEISSKVTEALAANFELGKSFLNCKSFEDVVSWGEKTLQTNLDHCVKTGGEIYSKACVEMHKANGEVAKKFGECVAKVKNSFEHSDK